jgi:hypothetical protein
MDVEKSLLLDERWQDSLALSSFLQLRRSGKQPLEGAVELPEQSAGESRFNLSPSDKVGISNSMQMLESPFLSTPRSDPLTLKSLESSAITHSRRPSLSSPDFRSSSPTSRYNTDPVSSMIETNHNHNKSNVLDSDEDDNVDTIGLRVLLKTALRDKDVVTHKLQSVTQQVEQLQASNNAILLKSTALYATTVSGRRWRLPCVLTCWSIQKDRQMSLRTFARWRHNTIDLHQSLLRRDTNVQQTLKLARNALAKARYIVVLKSFLKWKQQQQRQDLVQVFASQRQRQLTLIRQWCCWKHIFRRTRCLKRVITRRSRRADAFVLHCRWSQWRSAVNSRHHAVLLTWQSNNQRMKLMSMLHKLHNSLLSVQRSFLSWKNKIFLDMKSKEIKQKLLRVTLQKIHFHPLLQLFLVWKKWIFTEKPRVYKAIQIYDAWHLRMRLQCRQRAFVIWRRKTSHHRDWSRLLSYWIKPREQVRRRVSIENRWKQWKQYCVLERANLDRRSRLVASAQQLGRRSKAVRSLSRRISISIVANAWFRWQCIANATQCLVAKDKLIAELKDKLSVVGQKQVEECTQRDNAEQALVSLNALSWERDNRGRRNHLRIWIKYWLKVRLAWAWTKWVAQSLCCKFVAVQQCLKQDASLKYQELAAFICSSTVDSKQLGQCFNGWSNLIGRRRILRRIFSGKRRRLSSQAWSQWSKMTWKLNRQQNQHFIAISRFFANTKRQWLLSSFSIWRQNCQRWTHMSRMLSRVSSVAHRLLLYHQQRSFSLWSRNVLLIHVDGLSKTTVNLCGQLGQVSTTAWLERWKYVTKRRVLAKISLSKLLSKGLQSSLRELWKTWRRVTRARATAYQICVQLMHRVNNYQTFALSQQRENLSSAFAIWKSLLLDVRYFQAQANQERLIHEQNFLQKEIKRLKVEYKKSESEVILLRSRQEHLSKALTRSQSLILLAINRRHHQIRSKTCLTLWYVLWNSRLRIREKGRTIFLTRRKHVLQQTMNHWLLLHTICKVQLCQSLYSNSIEISLREQLRCERIFRKWRDRVASARERKKSLKVVRVLSVQFVFSYLSFILYDGRYNYNEKRDLKLSYCIGISLFGGRRSFESNAHGNIPYNFVFKE